MEQTTENRLIYGRNAVQEALKAKEKLDAVYTSIKDSDPFFRRLWAMCKEAGALLKQVDAKKLDDMCSGGVHQGVAAFAAAFEYSSLDDLFALAAQRGEPVFLIVADGIEDPHNLGAIIRTAECAGAHGIVIGERRSASVTGTAVKASAGATAYLKVARVGNIASAIDDIKEKGVFVYGADMEGEDYRRVNLGGNVCLVVGSEGRGISRLVKEKCDQLVSLPQVGRVNSLNASVAAGILIYEVVRTRQGR